MFEGLSPTHLILILVIALLILGPGKLPEVGAALGKTVRELRQALEGREEAPVSPPSQPPAPPTGTSASPVQPPEGQSSPSDRPEQ